MFLLKSEWESLYDLYRPLDITPEQAEILTLGTLRRHAGGDDTINGAFSNSILQKALVIGIINDQLPVKYVFSPYIHGPYCPKVADDLRVLVQRGFLEKFQLIHDGRASCRFRVANQTYRTIKQEIMPSLQEQPILPYLVRIASYLGIQRHELIRRATDLLNAYLDSPARSIIYVSKELKDTLKGNTGRSTWQINYAITPIHVSFAYAREENDRDDVDDNIIMGALWTARNNTPTDNLFLYSKLERGFSWKFIVKTNLGTSPIYTPLPEFTRILQNQNEPTIERLKRSCTLKSIGTVTGPYSVKNIGGQKFQLFIFDTQTLDPQYCSTIPLLIHPAMMRTSIEILTASVCELFWKPCNFAQPGVIEAYPLAITKLYDLAQFE